jgi:homoprotocatechuate degradation regulator HpaR
VTFSKQGAQGTLPAAANVGVHGSEAVPPVPNQDSDDVLPNMLLDVREGFLAVFRPVFRQFGVTDQQFRVLSILHIAGDTEISKLARRCRIVAPSMTGILNRMVEAGWVVRKGSKGQRWGVISLTAKGRKLIRELQPPVDEHVAAITAALGADQLGILVKQLVNARTVLSYLAPGSGKSTSVASERTQVSRRISRNGQPAS